MTEIAEGQPEITEGLPANASQPYDTMVGCLRQINFLKGAIDTHEKSILIEAAESKKAFKKLSRGDSFHHTRIESYRDQMNYEALKLAEAFGDFLAGDLAPANGSPVAGENNGN
jgi:hypothetical protein